MLRFATCLLLLSTALTRAEPLPIDFAQIPVGTNMYYSNSFQGRMVDTYLGQSGDHHHVERRAGSPYGELIADLYFSPGGLEVRRVTARGRELTFVPYNCERSIGTCRHTLTTPRGSQEVLVETTETHGIYRSTITFGATGTERRRRFELGDHGLYSFIRENDTQIALDAIAHP